MARLKAWARRVWAALGIDAEDRTTAALLVIRVSAWSLVALIAAGTAGVSVRLFGAASGLW